MGSICNKISFYFKVNLDMEEDDRQVIEYALFVILGSLIEFGAIFFIAYLLEMLKYTIILVFSFMVFRIFSGGVHCSTYKNCFIVSVGTIIFFSGIIKAFEILINYKVVIGLYVIINIYSGYCILKYVPGDTNNRPIKDELEKIKFKKYTTFVLFVFDIVILYFIHYKVNYAYIASGLMGLFLQIVSTTPIGYLFIKKIDNIIN